MTQTILQNNQSICPKYTSKPARGLMLGAMIVRLKFYLFSWKIEHTEKEVQKVDDHWMRKLKVF